ncbi:Eco57I restriction-modification methylase domain-containing protein [Leptospira dzoumogneensis]|uniref:site-specific DNA-methyltransferase (adenine-specific) n=1 Tax=Leptospira dzoumogneensis TaxID=2484904 RepID=A0A4Z1ATX3_9LEPT|nr:TaqI-like C-terminal specificity domain-containing protein [Leptospira dzoumogneensis]TGM99487.1 endonuclease [Leptospira dzoumogneensis]
MASLDKWRVVLAQNIALRNKNLEEDELNFVVQHTIDRIIFLRIAEDRRVEDYGELQKSVTSGDEYYQNLLRNFYIADRKYNSGLFDFDKDKISTHISIDNKVIKSIIEELYYPVCPYEFAVLPVEILGTAYEQFLGKTITINTAHRAKIEEKPEVRKAGGVYYTPQYIVDYIVKNTIGKLVEGKTPKEITKLKIADPACGSGSFLIGAYNYLLEWHLDFYTKKETLAKKDKALTPTGALSTSIKKQILLNNIYGVDIDVNAVEVTKLSLLLKCMEGETQASVEMQMELFHDRVLPTLDNNIKSGNSLVDLDYYEDQFDFKDEKKIKPFSWQKAFPEVFKQGGFNCVIGNPPYAQVTDKSLVIYFNEKYFHQDYQQDLYLLFLEKYKHLLLTGGMLGVIIPNTWLQSIKFRNIRKYLTTEFNWKRILHINEHIFKAVVDTHVLLFEMKGQAINNKVVIDIFEKNRIKEHQTILQNSFPNNGDTINILSKENEKKLFEKIKNLSNSIREVSNVYNGVKPFEKGKGNPPQTEQTMKEKPFVVEDQEKPKGKNWLPLLRGSLINRYVNFWNNNSWIQYGEWLAAPRDPKIFEAKEKIIIRQTSDSIIATLIEANIICRNNLHILISTSDNHKFLLGILNSRLSDFYYFQINPERGEVLAEVKKQHVEQLPFPKNASKKQQAEIAQLVEQLLHLNAEKQKTKLTSKMQQLQNHIDYCEDKINKIVYEIYGLAEEEIAIVEAN